MVQKTSPADRAPEVAGLLSKVANLLGDGKPGAALAQINRTALRSPWVTNAAAVCPLRAGNAKAGVETFRGLVLAPGGLVVRDDVPAVFKVNFATALLADGNLAGGLRALAEIREDHPAVSQIREAVRRWR